MDARSMKLTETFSWRGSNVRWRMFGDGPPVVLCHGTPFSSLVWRHLIDVVAGKRSVYVWDMLGYGQSDKPDADVSLAAQGEILTALVAHWEIGSPDIVAHDFGGAVTLRAHLIHGLRVSSLALIDVVAVSPWGTPFFRLVNEHLQVFNDLPPNFHEALLREYISGATNRRLAEDVMDLHVAPWLGEEGQAAFYRQMAQGDERYTVEFEPRLGEVTAPTLIVWGAEDAWLSSDQGRTLAQIIANSRLHLIEGAGHLVQEDEPEQLAPVIADWLVHD
jgi:pimeloyl-ACP methyl ester carboxylesterase